MLLARRATPSPTLPSCVSQTRCASQMSARFLHVPPTHAHTRTHKHHTPKSLLCGRRMFRARRRLRGLISARCGPQSSGDDRRRCSPLEVDYTEAWTPEKTLLARGKWCVYVAAQLTARPTLVKRRLTTANNVNREKPEEARNANFFGVYGTPIARHYARHV